MNVLSTQKFRLGDKSGSEHAVRYLIEMDGDLYEAVWIESGAIITQGKSATRTPKEKKERLKLFVKNMSENKKNIPVIY